LASLGVADLKERLREKGLPLSGNKAALIQRLAESNVVEEADDAEEAEEAEEAEQEEETPLPASSSRSSGGAFEAGQLVLARFAEDNEFYTAKLLKTNKDGSWAIRWAEDGSKDTADSDDLRIHDKHFKRGDLVWAKCAADGEEYTATYQSEDGEGSVTVKYLADEEEEEVLLDDVRAQTRKFMVGQAVEAVFNDGEWYGAKVVKDLGKCRYTVEWDEDDDGEGPIELLIDDMRHPRIRVEDVEVGQKMVGVVNRIEDYGAFFDCGIIYMEKSRAGLCHVTRMHATRRIKVRDILSMGDERTVWVIGVDKPTGRISLSLLDPGVRSGTNVRYSYEELEVGNRFDGIVKRLESYGCFVDIGLERPGLVHVTRMSDIFVDNPSDFVQPGDEVEVWVQSIDIRTRRVDLSMVEIF